MVFCQTAVEVMVGAITYALLVLFVPFGIKRFYGGDPSALLGGIVLMARSASRTGGGSSAPRAAVAAVAAAAPLYRLRI